MGITSMMKKMVKAFPVEEREELMLTMMPEIMKEINLAEMMPHMLKEMGQMINLYSIYNFISVASKDEELKKILKDGLADIKAGMPGMMEKMKPMMEFMMSMKMQGMPKIMEAMSPMMPMMASQMPKMMNEKMIPLLKENPEMKKNMLTMMQTVFPHCTENMFPLIEKTKRVKFMNELIQIMKKVANKEA